MNTLKQHASTTSRFGSTLRSLNGGTGTALQNALLVELEHQESSEETGDLLQLCRCEHLLPCTLYISTIVLSTTISSGSEILMIFASKFHL